MKNLRVPLKILTEASGGLTSGYIIKAIQDAGHLAIASDIDTRCFARFLADGFVAMPQSQEQFLWDKIELELKKNKIDVIIPSLDETLLQWAERKQYFSDAGFYVVLSEPDTISICQDKWKTFLFFKENNIPTPETSLNQVFPLIKPRHGRGSSGIQRTLTPVDMDGMISQEIINGVEYTVDVFCDINSEPIYIVPRRRLKICEGKSVNSIVEEHDEITRIVRRICSILPFLGPINLQCFDSPDVGVKFIEINPRIAGGMALGFAATENWVNLIIESFILGKKPSPQPVKFGLEMRRYYAEVFF